jgi:hypothetical protein
MGGAKDIDPLQSATAHQSKAKVIDEIVRKEISLVDLTSAGF